MKTFAFNFRFLKRKYHLFQTDKIPVDLPVKSLCNRQKITQDWSNLHIREYKADEIGFITCELCKEKL